MDIGLHGVRTSLPCATSLRATCAAVWCGAPGGGTTARKVEPRGFTGCVGYTKDGARALLKHLGKVEVGHDEVIMKRLFNSPHPEPFPRDHHASMGDHIKASYVLCAVGNYCEHVSGCAPAYAKKPRPASWNEHWAQEWTHGWRTAA